MWEIDGEVFLWAEPGGPIMLKAITSYGDPVELSGTEARAIAERLLKLVEEPDGEG